VIEEVARVARIQDHTVRVRAAADLMAELQAGVVETARMRRESIAWLRSNGYSMADVARLMGVSRARVAQLKESGPPPERIFVGAEHVRIAVPLRPGEREYVAVEDSSTGQRLASFVQAMQLTAEVEYIPTSGRIDLNRDSLLVVCGPKTSPHTAAALATDPRLSFATLPDGRWFLADRRTGQSITSPSDDPSESKPADVAYLGRLARPDGNGTFLLIAGVHAVGSLGAAQYLTEHLGELYKHVGLNQFSMVIGCEYDPETKAITSVYAETDPLLHADG
jgi:transcriptional regulator with XRE-family HTH domain